MSCRWRGRSGSKTRPPGGARPAAGSAAQFANEGKVREIFNLLLFLVVAFVCSLITGGLFHSGRRFWLGAAYGTVIGAAGAEAVWMAAPHVTKALVMGLWGAAVMGFVTAWLASGNV